MLSAYPVLATELLQVALKNKTYRLKPKYCLKISVNFTMSPPWHLYGPFFIIIVSIIIAISIFCFVGIICCLCNAHRDLQTNRRQQQPSVRMRRIRSNSSDKKLQQFDEIGRMGLGHGQVGERCHIVSEGRRSGKVVSGRNKAGSTPKRRITKPHIVAGRLYGQSYEMLRYKAAEAGKLFCDDQVILRIFKTELGGIRTFHNFFNISSLFNFSFLPINSP